MNSTLKRKISLYAMAAVYTVAGILHFIRPEFYLKIMPDYLPLHLELVYISGVAEIALGLALLVPQLSTKAAWGVILLLIAVFPANIYHLTSGGAGMDLPEFALWLRLPIQGLLIWWAWLHTRPAPQAA